ncbi:MAG: Inward rectifier potassium channel Irk [Bacteroidetes bacterium]|nr:MAG: Inward rectifier potassium channel Irk [Bacteroidota bacterium]
MAILKRFNTRAKAVNDTGFGVNSNDSGGRFVNRDGHPNVAKRGIPILERYSWFHSMLALSRWKFLFLIMLAYIIINIFFGLVYTIIGVESLGGVVKGTAFHNFLESFFFSLQTYTTVGYGRISPIGYLTSFIAAFEAFLGLMTFALATGLMYARFSRPNAYLKFSSIAVIAPYKNGSALMFRFVPFKNNYLTDAEVKVSLAMKPEENGSLTNRFFNLQLELSKINALALSWTIVHAIDETSPLYGMSADDIKNTFMEVMVFVKAFDEAYSNTVLARTSYTNSEIVFGAKFKIMYHPDSNSQKTILQIDELDDIERKELPVLAAAGN